jgi:hypothetical protein
MTTVPTMTTMTTMSGDRYVYVALHQPRIPQFDNLEIRGLIVLDRQIDVKIGGVLNIGINSFLV